MIRLKLDNDAIAKVKDKLFEALNSTTQDLGKLCTEEVIAEKWMWSDGELRDIVDTGALRDSLIIEREPATNTMRLVYPLEYSAINHEGGVSHDGFFFTPRPWITSAVSQFDFVESFKISFVI